MLAYNTAKFRLTTSDWKLKCCPPDAKAGFDTELRSKTNFGSRKLKPVTPVDCELRPLLNKDP